MEIQVVGVVGAGVIGSGVAQVLLEAGRDVILVDVSEEQLQTASSEMKRQGRLRRLLSKNEGAPGATSKPGQLALSTDHASLARSDFVIENVTENWNVKKEVYTKLDGMCPDSTIFAVNTSAIPITRIASLTKRPQKVIGIHFMNPVPLKPMVEVIRGYQTSDETLGTAKALLASMGKECVVVEDSPGFVSNRVLMLMINEAICLLQDRVASAEDVDRLFKGCFGHKMGPLETADLIGLDTILFTIEVLYENYNDNKYRPCPLLRKMVDAGLHGRKCGKGFYEYGDGMQHAARV